MSKILNRLSNDYTKINLSGIVLLFCCFLLGFSCTSTKHTLVRDHNVNHLSKSGSPINAKCESPPQGQACEPNFTKLDLCIDCQVCKTKEIKFVKIILESQPYHDGTNYGIFKLDDNYQLNRSVCVEIISDQASQILGIGLIEAPGKPPTLASFENLNMSKDSTKTTLSFSKTITQNDISGECKKKPLVVFSDDPVNHIGKGKSYTCEVCVIGSFADCKNADFNSESSLKDITKAATNIYEDLQNTYLNSIPCSGIYVKFK